MGFGNALEALMAAMALVGGAAVDALQGVIDFMSGGG